MFYLDRWYRNDFDFNLFFYFSCMPWTNTATSGVRFPGFVILNNQDCQDARSAFSGSARDLCISRSLRNSASLGQDLIGFQRYFARTRVIFSFLIQTSSSAVFLAVSTATIFVSSLHLKDSASAAVLKHCRARRAFELPLYLHMGVSILSAALALIGCPLSSFILINMDRIFPVTLHRGLPIALTSLFRRGKAILDTRSLLTAGERLCSYL